MAVGEVVVTGIFKSLATLQRIYIGNTNWIWCIFFSFSFSPTVSGGHKGGRVNLGGMGKEHDQGTLYKLCK